MSEPSVDLLEAEELRKAIIGGEVDAFVVGREDGNRKVLLLANAYQRYRQLVEKMQQGAITTSPQGGILYANQRFSQLLGIPLAHLYTAPLQSYVRAPDGARLAAFLGRGNPSSIEITSPAEPKKMGKARGLIEFQNVWFAYKGEDWVLKDVSFKVELGESVALVGHTGSGKTTITNLIMRFYDVQKGRIIVDGVDVREWDLHALRSNFAV